MHIIDMLNQVRFVAQSLHIHENEAMASKAEKAIQEISVCGMTGVFAVLVLAISLQEFSIARGGEGNEAAWLAAFAALALGITSICLRHRLSYSEAVRETLASYKTLKPV